jgi:hypothetical protein
VTARTKRILSTAFLLIIIIVSICKVSDFLRRKDSDLLHASFLTEDEDIDVVILGTSHMLYGIFPMELWNDYGISAYNLAGDGNTIPVCYWTLVNALDYQKPQIVALDVYDFAPGSICNPEWGQVRDQFDFFPLSINKYRMVEDLFSNPELTDRKGNNLYDKRWELLWDLGEYHTRWTDLGENDFYSESELKQQSAVWKCAMPLIDFEDRTARVYPDNWDDVEYDDLSKEYLIKIIDLCRENGIELMLVNTGYDCRADSKLFADSVYDIASEYGLLYFDFTQMDLINFQTDLYSSGHNTHVNFSGAEKWTKYVGECLNANYSLADHRNDSQYAHWWEEYQEFIVSKADYLQQQTEPAYYLMFLADDDYQTIIEVKDASILSEDRNQAMLENLGVEFDKIGDCNLLVIDNGTKAVSYLKNEYDKETVFDTCLGEIVSSCSESGVVYELYLNGKELYTTEMTGDNERMRVTVLRKDTGEMVDIKSFS